MHSGVVQRDKWHERKTLRVFYNELAQDALRHFGEKRCPCCRNPMEMPKRLNARTKVKRDRRTVAHDVATTQGGNPVVWVYACNGCNNDQKDLDFDTWAYRLSIGGDKRAPYVAELARFIIGWCEAHGVPRILP